MSTVSNIHDCCLRGFAWDGTPTGRVPRLGPNDVYIAGPDSSSTAILLIHDLYGWTFPNLRLLADHFASETGATVYLPDFFGGEAAHVKLLKAECWDLFDIKSFMSRNGCAEREAEVFALVLALRAEKGHAKIASVGYCYGGRSSFRLGAREHEPRLVDCISVGHPSLLTKEGIDGVGVLVQMLAPEIDAAYTRELKTHTWETLQRLGVPFDYRHFPGVEHYCFVRGNEKVPGERDAMVRGENAAVAWVRQWLLEAK